MFVNNMTFIKKAISAHCSAAGNIELRSAVRRIYKVVAFDQNEFGRSVECLVAFTACKHKNAIPHQSVILLQDDEAYATADEGRLRR